MRLLLILFVCAAASPALAGPNEEANAAYDGEYATAVRIYRSLAENGEARAPPAVGDESTFCLQC